MVNHGKLCLFYKLYLQLYPYYNYSSIITCFTYNFSLCAQKRKAKQQGSCTGINWAVRTKWIMPHSLAGWCQDNKCMSSLFTLWLLLFVWRFLGQPKAGSKSHPTVPKDDMKGWHWHLPGTSCQLSVWVTLSLLLIVKGKAAFLL